MQDLLDAMAKNQADFTLTFRRLGDAARDADDDERRARCSPIPPPSTNGPRAGAQRLGAGAADRRPSGSAAMRAVNPAFIPRNHRVEAVIQAAVEQRRLRAVRGIADGAGEAVRGSAEFAAYADPPLPEQRVMQTFCGT